MPRLSDLEKAKIKKFCKVKCANASQAAKNSDDYYDVILSILGESSLDEADESNVGLLGNLEETLALLTELRDFIGSGLSLSGDTLKEKIESALERLHGSISAANSSLTLHQVLLQLNQGNDLHSSVEVAADDPVSAIINIEKDGIDNAESLLNASGLGLGLVMSAISVAKAAANLKKSYSSAQHAEDDVGNKKLEFSTDIFYTLYFDYKKLAATPLDYNTDIMPDSFKIDQYPFDQASCKSRVAMLRALEDIDQVGIVELSILRTLSDGPDDQSRLNRLFVDHLIQEKISRITAKSGATSQLFQLVHNTIDMAAIVATAEKVKQVKRKMLIRDSAALAADSVLLGTKIALGAMTAGAGSEALNQMIIAIGGLRAVIKTNQLISAFKHHHGLPPSQLEHEALEQLIKVDEECDYAKIAVLSPSQPMLSKDGAKITRSDYIGTLVNLLLDEEYVNKQYDSEQRDYEQRAWHFSATTNKEIDFDLNAFSRLFTLRHRLIENIKYLKAYCHDIKIIEPFIEQLKATEKNIVKMKSEHRFLHRHTPSQFIDYLDRNYHIYNITEERELVNLICLYQEVTGNTINPDEMPTLYSSDLYRALLKTKTLQWKPDMMPRCLTNTKPNGMHAAVSYLFRPKAKMSKWQPYIEHLLILEKEVMNTTYLGDIHREALIAQIHRSIEALSNHQKRKSIYRAKVIKQIQSDLIAAANQPKYELAQSKGPAQHAILKRQQKQYGRRSSVSHSQIHFTLETEIRELKKALESCSRNIEIQNARSLDQLESVRTTVDFIRQLQDLIGGTSQSLDDYETQASIRIAELEAEISTTKKSVIRQELESDKLLNKEFKEQFLLTTSVRKQLAPFEKRINHIYMLDDQSLFKQSHVKAHSAELKKVCQGLVEMGVPFFVAYQDEIAKSNPDFSFLNELVKSRQYIRFSRLFHKHSIQDKQSEQVLEDARQLFCSHFKLALQEKVLLDKDRFVDSLLQTQHFQAYKDQVIANRIEQTVSALAYAQFKAERDSHNVIYDPSLVSTHNRYFHRILQRHYETLLSTYFANSEPTQEQLKALRNKAIAEALNEILSARQQAVKDKSAIQLPLTKLAKLENLVKELSAPFDEEYSPAPVRRPHSQIHESGNIR